MAESEHLLDAGPLAAFIDARDRDHAWSKRELGKLKPPLITCEAVLSETLFLLSGDPAAPQKIATLFERGLLVSHPLFDQDAGAVLGLMQTYRDRPMSLADGCLVRLSEKIRGSVVVTLDSDFTVYRRHRRQAIPVRCPRR
ncbi:MAG: type II toxin-antitoxin system VapC family toxin [Opitutaceae bacterium]